MVDNSTSSSINSINGLVVVTLPADLFSEAIHRLKEKLFKKISEPDIKGVIFDFSMLRAIDSYEYNSISNIIKTTGMLGAEPVVVGIKPGLVNAFLDLGVDTKELNAFLDLEAGFEYFSQKMAPNTNEEVEPTENSIESFDEAE